MSRKPPQQGQENKKKKTFVPPSENAIAKKEIMQLDEAEIEHLRELDSKYRDRAKERREGILEGDEEYENFDDENLLVEDGEEEYYTTVKGLDYELLMKQKEKEAEENQNGAQDFIEEQNRKEKERMEQALKEKRDIKGAFRTVFAGNIHRVLFKEQAKKESRRNIYKSSNFYEFDVDMNFGSTLPKLVIRRRDKQEEQERMVTAKVGENVLGKINKIMTYIKTGKKAEHKKPDLHNDHKFQPQSGINPISTQNMSDEDDEDSIFPDAKKKVKREAGPMTSLFEKHKEEAGPNTSLFEKSKEESKEDKGEQKTVKGLFSSLRPDQKSDMEEEAPDVAEGRRIAEKNKHLLAELAKKKAEEKLEKLQHKDDDYYMECFPKDAPELEELKNRQKAMGGKGKSNKSKKKELNKQFDKVSKIMTEKRGGGGGGPSVDE